jgi:hypothetical protein
MVVGCGGKKCLTTSAIKNTKERCLKRKDGMPNLNPTGMTFMSPVSTNASISQKNDSTQSNCEDIGANYFEHGYDLFKHTADYQKFFYKNEYTISPGAMSLKTAKLFLKEMLKSPINQKFDPRKSGIDYIVFETETDDLTEKNIYFTRENKLVSAKDIGIAECE